MKLFCSVLAIGTCLLLGCSSGHVKFFPVETIDQIKRVTVPVVCGASLPDGSLKVTSTIGSAFFINKEGYFMTAGHVLDDWDKIDRRSGDCFPVLYVPKEGWQNLEAVRWLRFRDCIRSSDVDIAVCKPIDNPFQLHDIKQKIGFATFTSQPLPDGTPVAFTGFPLESLRPITSLGDIASSDRNSHRVIIDRSAWPGASGSPVYLDDGRVIGVLIKRGTNDASGLAYALTTEAIFDFLNKKGIDFNRKN